MCSAPKAPSMPAPVIMKAPDPLPDTREVEAESKNIRDDEKRKMQNKRGHSSTVLTSPLGVSGNEAGSGMGSTLLGKFGK